jgi:hypothetical protein
MADGSSRWCQVIPAIETSYALETNPTRIPEVPNPKSLMKRIPEVPNPTPYETKVTYETTRNNGGHL